MSEATISTIVTVASLLISLVAGFGWTIRRMDGIQKDLRNELSDVDTRIRKDLSDVDTRIRKDLSDVDTRIRKDLGDQLTSLGDRITGVERELVEVKIAVARLEGPGRHLVSTR